MTPSPQQGEPSEIATPSPASTLNWLLELVGAPFVEYLLNCDPATVLGIAGGSFSPTKELREAIAVMEGVRQALPKGLGQEVERRAVSNWLASGSGDQIPRCRIFHATLGGPPLSIATMDEAEALLASIAEDVYAAFLLPDDLPEGFSIPGRVGIHATRAIFAHPKAQELSDLILRDSTFGPLFELENEHTGRVSPTIYRSTGTGGSIQLMMLPEILMGRAWNGIADGRKAPYVFVEGALAGLRNLRGVIKNKKGTIRCQFAFMGILLPPTSTLAINGGVIRGVNEHDRKFAPTSLEGQLNGTDSTGVSTTINYDGDVLLEMQVPLKIRIQHEEPGKIGLWPEDMRHPAEVSTTIERMRFALMLAVERDSRVQLIPTWQRFDDPFSIEPTMSWVDPRQSPGIMPYQLTEPEVAEWGEWFKRLNRPSVRKIELALTRILRAVGERREPSDVLIDSVIAWENLFGTKEGEPTFRISTCLAVLLKTTLEDRVALRSKLSKIYALRSKVVHGSGHLQPAEFPMCYEALDVAIRAVRALVVDRTDILDLPDGVGRSSTLLLGG